MISVACYIEFPNLAMTDSMQIDAHRSVVVKSGYNGVGIEVTNGQQKTRMSMSYEAATALYRCLEQALARHYELDCSYIEPIGEFE